MIENEKKKRRQKKLQQLGGQKYSTYCLKEYNRKRQQKHRAATAIYKLIKQLRSDSSQLPASKPVQAYTGRGNAQQEEAAGRKGGETRVRGPGSRELKEEESDSEETDTRHWTDAATENQQVLKPYVQKRMEYPEPAEYKVP